MIALKPMAVKPTDVIKMRSTIKSFLRDWSKEVIIIQSKLQFINREKKKENSVISQ